MTPEDTRVASKPFSPMAPLCFLAPAQLVRPEAILSVPKHFFLNLFFFFCSTMKLNEILVPCPGIESVLPSLVVQSLNHWTARKIPISKFYVFIASQSMPH